MYNRLALNKKQFDYLDSIYRQTFTGESFPEGTVLVGVGIRSHRDIDPSFERGWFYFDVFNENYHHGAIVRLWGAFPEWSDGEDAASFQAMLHSSGMAETFLTQTPEDDDLHSMEYANLND